MVLWLHVVKAASTFAHSLSLSLSLFLSLSLSFSLSPSLPPQEMFFNAVLAELVARKGVSKQVFQLNHPGGSIGVKLSTSS